MLREEAEGVLLQVDPVAKVRADALRRAVRKMRGRAGVVKIEEEELPGLLERRAWRLLSPGGAAGVVGVHRATVWFLITHGRVRAWATRRGEVYVDVGDLVRWALARGHKVPPGWRKYGEGNE